jgi:hypothetical protein
MVRTQGKQEGVYEAKNPPHKQGSGVSDNNAIMASLFVAIRALEHVKMHVPDRTDRLFSSHL